MLTVEKVEKTGGNGDLTDSSPKKTGGNTFTGDRSALSSNEPKPKSIIKSEPTYGYNDLYHARKIVELHGQNIRYCKHLGGFLLWYKTHWAVDSVAMVWHFAIDTAMKISHEIRRAGTRPELGKWAAAAESSRYIEDALKQLRVHFKIRESADSFDCDPWLFNVLNGTIDLRTGQLRQHRREDLITRVAPVEFDPAAVPHRWIQFIDEIFDGNRALIEFVQRACGYALTGSVREQKLFFLHGGGANGKTTFLDTLMYLMGRYSRRMPPDLLFASRADMHPTGFADLRGRRLAVTPEVEFGKRLAEVAVKELTGGDLMTARHMRQDYFQFRPTHKIFMCGNHLPVIRGTDHAICIRGTDHAIWRRIMLIPFTVTFPEERQDKELSARLRAEASGILNWLVEGFLEWQNKGLAEPAEVTTATGAYRSEMDILGDFINDCCTIAPDADTSSADLNRAYKEWCSNNGDRLMSSRWLGLRLRERGLTRIQTGPKRARAWKGIGLRGGKSSEDNDRDGKKETSP